MLAESSARFLILPTAEVDGAITDALRQIVELIGVDRSQLVRFSSDNTARVTHSWAVNGILPVSPISPADKFPWLIGRLRAGDIVVMPRVVEDMPSEAEVDKASFFAGRSDLPAEADRDLEALRDLGIGAWPPNSCPRRSAWPCTRRQLHRPSGPRARAASPRSTKIV